jgi:cyclohexadieny/prephenate dehydrogenase
MAERLGPPRAVPQFERVAIVGFGLIGSSIARAARHLNLVRKIVAIDFDEAVLERVRALEIADEATSDLADRVALGSGPIKGIPNALRICSKLPNGGSLGNGRHILVERKAVGAAGAVAAGRHARGAAGR